jgi:hypothetical protein
MAGFLIVPFIKAVASWAATIYSTRKSVAAYRRAKAQRELSSITYKVSPENTDISRDEPVAIVYGKNRVTGTLIYQEETDISGQAYDAAYAFCEGEVEEVTEVQLNGSDILDLAGSSATTYTGTATQVGDSIFESGLFRVYASANAFVVEDDADTAYHPLFPNNLRVKKAGSGADERTYIRFDLSALPPGLTVASAKLVVHSKARSVSGRVIVYTTANDAWAEDTVTWNTKPTDGVAASGQKNFADVNTNQIFPLNVAGLADLSTQYAAGTNITYFIKWYSENMNGSYASRESEYPSPYLEITYSGGTPCGYRDTAYAAVHIDPSNEKVGGANPVVTALVQGRKIKNWDTVGLAYQTTYSRNPAWQIYDLLINTRYGAGITETDIDDATFKTVASYCDATITDDDGNTVPRYTSDVVIDGGSDGFTAVNMILRTFAGFFYSANGKICLGVEKPPATLESTTGLLLDCPLTQASYTSATDIFDDNSPLNRDATSINEASFNTLASALTVWHVNGTTDLVDTDSDWIDDNAVTVTAWIRPETAGENSAGHIYCNGKFVVALDNTNARISVTSDGGTTTVYSSINAWVANTWCFLEVSRSATGAVNIKINGELFATANQASGTPEAGTTNVFLGNRSAADRTFDGDLSCMRAFDGIISHRQSLNLFNNTRSDYGV